MKLDLQFTQKERGISLHKLSFPTKRIETWEDSLIIEMVKPYLDKLLLDNYLDRRRDVVASFILLNGVTIRSLVIPSTAPITLER